MALQFIGSANGTTTLTFPEHKIGDLLIIYAFRDGSVTNPTIGAGFSSVTSTTDGTLCSISIGYRFATVTNTASGTWTNASRIIGVIYRGYRQRGIVSPFNTSTYTGNTTNTFTYGAITAGAPALIGGSWIIAFSGHGSVDQNLQDPPDGLTLRDNSVDAVCEVSAFDSNGPFQQAFPATTVTLTGTVGNGHSAMLVLMSDEQEFNNHKVITSRGNAGVLSINSGGGW